MRTTIAFLLMITGCISMPAQTVTSPNKRMSATLTAADGQAAIRFSCDGNTAVEQIQLGLTVNGIDCHKGLAIKEVGEIQLISGQYVNQHGKRNECANEANELSAILNSPLDTEGLVLSIQLRVFNDGLCFRYLIDNPEGKRLTFDEEHTSYTMGGDCNRWLQQFVTSYEGDFPLQNGAELQGAWNYPLLFQSGATFYLVTEANPTRLYCTTHISNEAARDTYRVAYPFQWEGNGTGEVKPVSSAVSWQSPWRVVIAGKLADIVESTLVEDVSDPTNMTATDWIQSGSAAWVYWAYNHGTKDYQICCDYVDLAAEMGWEYVLFDWEWDAMSNGGNLEDAARYALSKGVKPLIWYNSGGPHNNVGSTPRDRFLTHESRVKELAWLKELGFVGVKIDFFESDKQNMMQYYLDILDDCADAQMMVNFHGCTLPRGWSRTYPHLMSMEAVYGAEQYNNSGNMTEIGSRINCTLPFTRNVVGPMDYTPVAFTNSQHPHMTTYAHELALSVAFESGIQHWADRPEGFRSLPTEAKRHMMNVPTAWDETKFIDGYPGTHFVVARRKGDVWYVAGLNGEKTGKTLTFTPSFLPEGQRQMTCFADGSHGAQFSITHRMVKSNEEISIPCLAQGGFTLVFADATYEQLHSLIQDSERQLSSAKDNVGTTDGQYDETRVTALDTALEAAKTVNEDASSSLINNAYITLANAFSALQTHGIVEKDFTQGDAVQPKSGGTDVTIQYLGEERGFMRNDEPKELSYSRFGLLASPWIVTDNILNQDGGTHGGFDSYNGGRYIGVEKWDDGMPAIEDGAIYQTTFTELPAGNYHLNLPMTEIWDRLNKNEIVLQVVEGTDFFAGSQLASYDMSQRDNSYNDTPIDVCEFQLATPATVSFGWKINIRAENSHRSMRIKSIYLYQDDTNVSDKYIANYEEVQRKDEPNTLSYYRFGHPAHWISENYEIDNGGDGVKRGIDNFPGYNCLQLGRWEENATKLDAADHANSRLYQLVTLPEGKYYFGASYNYIENGHIGDDAYICVTRDIVNTADIPSQALAYGMMKSASPGSTFYGVEFLLEEPQDVMLGWQMDSRPEHSEFRAQQVQLIRYDTPVDIQLPQLPATDRHTYTAGNTQIYNLSGQRLNAVPDHGIYILRQGTVTKKIYRQLHQ